MKPGPISPKTNLWYDYISFGEVTTVNDDRSDTAARITFGRIEILRFAAIAVIFLILSAVSAFAGGSSKGDPRTFGAYQIELDAGPVAVTIQGHSATQIVTISEEGIPSDIDVQYTESGGILHVKATYRNGTPPGDKLVDAGSTSGDSTRTDSVQATSSSDKSTTASTSIKAGTIVATMPRYEFVHIKTTSGSVSIDNLSTDHLTIATKTGGIHVTNTNAALKADSTLGDQDYEQIYGAIDASSTSGNVSVAHTWGTMKLSSRSGSFVGDNVALAGNSSFRTSSGSIKINLLYGLGRYSFDLKSASGSLRLGQISRTGDIRWGSGNITVTGVTDSGAQDFQ